MGGGRARGGRARERARHDGTRDAVSPVAAIDPAREGDDDDDDDDASVAVGGRTKKSLTFVSETDRPTPDARTTATATATASSPEMPRTPSPPKPTAANHPAADADARVRERRDDELLPSIRPLGEEADSPRSIDASPPPASSRAHSQSTPTTPQSHEKLLGASGRRANARANATTAGSPAPPSPLRLTPINAVSQFRKSLAALRALGVDVDGLAAATDDVDVDAHVVAMRTPRSCENEEQETAQMEILLSERSRHRASAQRLERENELLADRVRVLEERVDELGGEDAFAITEEEMRALDFELEGARREAETSREERAVLTEAAAAAARRAEATAAAAAAAERRASELERELEARGAADVRAFVRGVFRNVLDAGGEGEEKKSASILTKTKTTKRGGGGGGAARRSSAFNACLVVLVAFAIALTGRLHTSEQQRAVVGTYATCAPPPAVVESPFGVVAATTPATACDCDAPLASRPAHSPPPPRPPVAASPVVEASAEEEEAAAEAEEVDRSTPPWAWAPPPSGSPSPAEDDDLAAPPPPPPPSPPVDADAIDAEARAEAALRKYARVDFVGGFATLSGRDQRIDATTKASASGSVGLFRADAYDDDDGDDATFEDVLKSGWDLWRRSGASDRRVRVKAAARRAETALESSKETRDGARESARRWEAAAAAAGARGAATVAERQRLTFEASERAAEASSARRRYKESRAKAVSAVRALEVEMRALAG